MRVRYFEGWLKELIEHAGRDDVAAVETFAEAGLNDKPAGLRVTFADGARVFIQFVRTSPPGGEPPHGRPDYYGVAD